jgi:cardiolipin synthase C
MVQPENSYVLALRPAGPEARPRLVWDTKEDGKAIEYRREPARSFWQRLRVRVLSLLPLDKEL